MSSCNSSDADSSKQTFTTSTTKQAISTINGEDIYMQYCKLCHGADGKLGLNGSKDITESVIKREDRILLIKEGKNTMTPFKDILTEEEINAVAQYTMKMSGNK